MDDEYENDMVGEHEEKRIGCEVAALSFLGFFILLFLFLSLADGGESVGGIVILLLICIPFAYSIYHKKEKEKEYETYKNNISNAYERARKKKIIPSNSSLVINRKFYLWRSGDVLHMFAACWQANDFKEIIIPISNIYFYSREGEVHTEVSGSGGGSNYSMINGWNGKIDPVQISTEVKDSRKTVLIYKENSQDRSIAFTDADYLVLKRLIPEKDIAVVTAEETAKKKDTDIPQKKDVSVKEGSSIEEKLEKLKTLREKDLITQEEYEQRKEKILESL